MSYTNPNGWLPPRTTSGTPPSVPTHGNNGMGTGDDWTPFDGIADVDLKRMETNIKGLHTLLCQSGTFEATVNNPYFSAAVTGEWKWTRINNIVFLAIPTMTSPVATKNNELKIIPTTVWPDEILPDIDIIVPCIFTKDQSDNYSNRSGYFIMPHLNNAAIVCYITKYAGLNDTDGVFIRGNLGGDVAVGFSDDNAGGIHKAIPAQTVFYMTDGPPVLPAASTTTTTPVPTTTPVATTTAGP